nr:hypothetical protein [Tanacetum cinerariifolium]
MNLIVAQQVALNNALVTPENRVNIGICNMRIDPTKSPKEPTYQVVLDALALTTFYPPFLIPAEVSEIYMHQFWHTITKIKNPSSYKFKLDNKKCTIDVEELGYTGDIDYVTKVYTDHMHQPWKTFAAVINRCLSRKTIGLDKIRLSRAQIMWGMYYNQNVNFVELLWEDFMLQIDNKDSKKQEKMYYPRFTKAIIQHFISKDKSISMRNKLFMHTVQNDDSILRSLRFVSKSEEYQLYRALIPAEMTNRKMRNSTAYMTYLSFTTRVATPTKARKFKKPASPSMKKTIVDVEEPVEKPSNKSAARRQSAGVQIRDTPAALLEEAQLKKAIKRSKRETNIHQAGGSSEGVSLEPEVPDEQRGKSSDTSKGTTFIPGVLDVSKADCSKSEYESWGDSDDDNDDDQQSDDEQNVSDNPRTSDDEEET